MVSGSISKTIVIYAHLLILVYGNSAIGWQLLQQFDHKGSWSPWMQESGGPL
jgi:predicted Kef-type K+ transport protein